MRAATVLLALVACGKGAGDGKPGGGSAASGAAPASAPDPTCDDVAQHFADYISPTKSLDVWQQVHDDLLRNCKGNDFSVEERRCWTQIQDARSHQACLDLRKKLGKPSMKNIPSEEDKKEEEEMKKELEDPN
jgi:hypothetical protein